MESDCFTKNKTVIDNKKNDKKFIPFIQSNNSIDTNKMIFKQTRKSRNSKYSMYKTTYKYDESVEDVLFIQTSFTDYDKKKIYYSGSSYKYARLKFHPSFFDNGIIDCLIKYDALIENIIKNKHGEDFECARKLIIIKKSSQRTETITAKILNEPCFNRQYSKIISYNISKKYKKTDEFNLGNYNSKDLTAFLNKTVNGRKAIRIIFTPYTLIHKEDKIYFSYLKICAIEIKYKNSVIESPFDKNSILIKPDIMQISI